MGGTPPTFWKTFPGPRGWPDLKTHPPKPGQTAFGYPEEGVRFWAGSGPVPGGRPEARCCRGSTIAHPRRYPPWGRHLEDTVRGRFWTVFLYFEIAVWGGPGGPGRDQTSQVYFQMPWIRRPDFKFCFSRCLRIDPPGKFPLIYVVFFKPGPLKRPPPRASLSAPHPPGAA